MVLSACAQEAQFLAMLVNGFIPPESNKPVVIKGDNQGAISLVKNNIIQARTKHIDIRFHYIRYCYRNGQIDVVYIPTELNVADVMTKPVCKQKLDHFKVLLLGE